MKRVLIMAGGTGGHVFPALVVGQALRQQNIEVHWLGTRRGIENELVPKANFPISYISIGQWRGKGWKRSLLTPFLLARALWQTFKVFRKVKPDVVLGMGGFASGPGGITAFLFRKPLVIHEQNAIPGLTNRALGIFANSVLEAFPNTFSKRYRAVTIGNPVREEIVNLPLPKERLAKRKGPLRVLILGGSQGALAINKVIPSALSILSVEERPEVWHQTGTKGLDETRRMYKVLGLKARVSDFIENMAETYDWADLVICRAGALTLAELTAAGIGSILIPYPYAADNHQTRNAEFLVRANAAMVFAQKDFSSARLAELLRKLLKNREDLLSMADSARRLYTPNAAQKIIENCEKVCKKPKMKEQADNI